MKWSFANVGILIFGFFGILAITFFNELTVSNEQDYYTLKEAVEASMIEAVDITYFRLTGSIKINQEKFVENFTRRFSEVATYGEGNYNLEFYDISESPPKVSVRITDATNSYKIFGTFGSDPTQVDIVNEVTAIMDVYKDGEDAESNTPIILLPVKDLDLVNLVDNDNPDDDIYKYEDDYYRLEEGDTLPDEDDQCELYDDRIECVDEAGNEVILEKIPDEEVENLENSNDEDGIDDENSSGSGNDDDEENGLCAVRVVDGSATHYSNPDMFSTISQAQAHDYFLNTWFNKTYSNQYEYCEVVSSQIGDYCYWLITADCYKECDEDESEISNEPAIPEVPDKTISVNVVKFQGYTFIIGKTYYQIIPKYSYYLLYNNYTYVPIDISAPILQGNYSCEENGSNIVCTYNGKTYNYKKVRGVYENGDSPLKCFKVFDGKKKEGYFYSKKSSSGLFINWNVLGFEGFYFRAGGQDTRMVVPCNPLYYAFDRFEFGRLYNGGVGAVCSRQNQGFIRIPLGERNTICDD